MPSLPWVRWFPTNWASEPGLRLCDAATRGIWIELINMMMLRRQGSVTGTIQQLSAMCICRPQQMEVALIELHDYGVAEIANDEQNGSKTVTCRRLLREFRISEIRRDAALSSRSKTQANGGHLPASPSASASTSRVQGNGDGPCPQVSTGVNMTSTERITKDQSLKRILIELESLRGSGLTSQAKERRDFLKKERDSLFSQLGVNA